MEWRDVPGYEGLYEVSDTGEVWSSREDKAMSLFLVRGYPATGLRKNGKRKIFYVHRLVAGAFLPAIPGKWQVNHIDADKTNNNVNNLEWCTGPENLEHARRMGLREVGRLKKLKPIHQLTLDGDYIRTFGSLKEAAEITGISKSGISSAALGRQNKSGGYKWRYSDSKSSESQSPKADPVSPLKGDTPERMTPKNQGTTNNMSKMSPKNTLRKIL